MTVMNSSAAELGRKKSSKPPGNSDEDHSVPWHGAQQTGEGLMRGSVVAAAAIALGLAALPVTGSRAEDAKSTADLSEPAAGPTADDTWKQVLPYRDVQGVLGQEVTSSAGEKVGRIVQVLVDQNGQVRGAVIDFGGFLGVGSRKIVVDWAALHFAPTSRGQVTLDLTRDQIKAAPEYKDGQPVVVLGALPPSLPDM